MRTLPDLPFRRLLWLAPLIVTVNLAAQERPLPPSPPEPPELLGRERAQEPPPVGGSPSVDELLQRAGVSRAELERRKASPPAPPLPPSPGREQQQRELRELEERANERPPAPGRSPTLQDLLSSVRQQPGGAEVLERARRGGAQIPPGSEDDARDNLQARAARGGPSIEGATIELVPRRLTTQNVLKATRGAPSQTVSGLGSLSVYAHFPYWLNEYTIWGPLARAEWNSTSNNVGGPYSVKPWVSMSVNVQNAGWYLINVQATQTGAELRRWTSSGYTLVQTFTRPTTSGYNAYPVVLNLEAGMHYFYWTNMDWCYVSEVTVMKI
jgi:hypothetical protein